MHKQFGLMKQMNKKGKLKKLKKYTILALKHLTFVEKYFAELFKSKRNLSFLCL